jgi:hypothetical protein
MKEKLRKILDITDDVHSPIPFGETEAAEARLAQKPVIKSRLIDDMESLARWKVITDYSKSLPETLADPDDASDRLPIIPTPVIELSADRFVAGSKSLKFTHPTNLPQLNERGPGRIYAVPSAFRVVDREDWTEYNRLSAWIYPVAPGMKSITLRIQLHNDGVNKVPDVYERDGAHNISLKNEQWNFVVLEIPYLDREAVTGVSFDYDMCGHENDAADHVTWYLDQLSLDLVDADHYEGWIPKDDRICYSHSGYQPGGEKIAILSDSVVADHFKLIETGSGRVVLNKKIDVTDGKVGKLGVLDFTEITEEGEYILVAGDLTSRVFSISHDVWESSVWKALNFFLALRCGYEVPGKHRLCHTDMLLRHGDRSIVANGGWHDAADLAQSLTNTAEGASAFLTLAISLKDTGNDRLRKRVLEEAKWGLDYVLKMRFGDGYRSTYSSASIWTDGVIGTNDDITVDAVKSAYTNFDAAYAEALGAVAFAEIDPDYARYAQKIAEEDFGFGMEVWRQVEAAPRDFKTESPGFSSPDLTDPQVCSIGALAASKLYELTGGADYAKQAELFGDIVMSCQERRIPSGWDIPVTGYYYQDRTRDLIWHHNHHSFAFLPDLAMRTLCEIFPESAKYIDWYSALALSGEYYRKIASFTRPFGLIPAGVYAPDEAHRHGRKVLASHPAMLSELNVEKVSSDYVATVKSGFPLGGDHWLRVFPVWFSFRGNYNVLLSEALSINASAKLRNDLELHDIAQNQFEFIVGKNPFGQSTMYGEGYDYVQHYAVQPGQTVGSLTVGMESHFERDLPYWPQVNTATYKEVWVCSATKWIWNMADSLLPASVSGYSKVVDGAGEITFTNETTGGSFAVLPHARTGYYEITLPAGNYRMRYAGASRALTVVAGKAYRIDGALYDLTVRSSVKGSTFTLTLCLTGERDLPVEIRVSGVSGIAPRHVLTVADGKASLTLAGTLADVSIPYVGLVIPDGNLADAVEFM